MIEIISCVIMIFGAFFCLTSAIGCKRFPTYFTKMHALSVSDSFGCPLVLLGAALKASSLLLAIKILILVFLLLIVNPTNSYLLNNFVIKKPKA